MDSSFIANPRPIQIDSPLQVAGQAVLLNNLSQLSQMRNLQLQNQQREFNEGQAVRDAYNQNTSIGPNGMPQLNRAGMLSQLGTGGYGMQAMQQGANLGQMDLAGMQRAHAMASDLIGQMTDQDSYTENRLQGIAMGVPGFNQMPQEYDPNFVERAKLGVINVGQQLEQQNKGKDQQISGLNARANAANAGISAPPNFFNQAPPSNSAPLQGQGVGAGGPSAQPGQPAPPASAAQAAGLPSGFNPPPKMQFQAMQDYNTGVENSRQRPDASQALKDVQSAQKINEAIAQAPGGDLNKLNNNQVRLVTGELVKMATGGAPTETELESLTPNNVAQKYGGLLQKFTNQSAPANAAEFVKQFQNYANGIAGQGITRLTARSNEIADRLRPYMGAQQYKLVKGQIANEFNGALPPPSTPQAPANDYPIGTTAKSKTGSPVVYKGNGVWAPQ